MSDEPHGPGGEARAARSRVGGRAHSPWASDLRTAAAVAVGVLLAARLAYATPVRGSGVVVLWIPAGLVLGLLLLRERRAWPAVLAGAFLGNVAADLAHVPSVGMALAGSAANALESAVAAWLLVRVAGPRLRLDRVRAAVAFLVVGVVASTGLTALLGALVLRGDGWEGFGAAWLVWWAGDGIGMLVVAPLVLAVGDVVSQPAGAVRASLRPRRAGAYLALLAAVAGLSASLLTHQTAAEASIRLTPYMVLPALIFAALRFGPGGAAGALAALAAVTVARLAQDGALFASPRAMRESQVLDAYVFIALAGLTALVPAAVVRERERAVRRLAESEERYRELFESSALGIFRTTPAGRIELANPALVRLLGCSTAEEASRIDLESRARDTGYDRRRFREAMERDGAVVGLESEWERPDGSVVHVRENARAVRDAAGRVVAYEGTIEDVTRARAAEERLARGQKLEAVGRLAGGVAHDFNNILTAIIGFGEILLARKPLGDPDRQALEQIVRAGDRAAALTRQLLAFSRKEVRAPRPIDLNDAVFEIVPMLERLIGDNVELTARRCATPATVLADPAQLEQVLLNLCVNGRDAMPNGGSLEIGTAVEAFRARDPSESVTAGEYVVLTVSDTGVGMDREVRKRLFTPFFTTKAPGKGTGLGLATVYGIVRELGGHIDVASVEGVGTSFRVLLPFVGAAADACEADDAQAEARRGDGTETVLLVEDDERVREYAAEALEAAGYRVVAAGSGREALDAAAAAARIDLLVSDVVMPGMSGAELAEKVRERGLCARVLLVSGHADDAAALRGIKERRFAFLQKPFGPAALARAVRVALDAPTGALAATTSEGP